VNEIITHQAALPAFCVILALMALYLALRVVETTLKVLLWGVALVAGYVVAAPWFDWPGLQEMIAAMIDAATGIELADKLQHWLSLLRDVSGD